MTRDYAKKTYIKPLKRNKQNRFKWLFIGLFIGIVATESLRFTLTHRENLQENLRKVVQTKKSAPPAEPEKVVAKEPEKKAPRFDFYTVLSNEDPTAPIERKELTKYTLHIAEFNNLKQADQLRAELLLLGFNVRLETVNPSLYKISMGPFLAEEAKQLQKNLAQNNVKSTLIKNA